MPTWCVVPPTGLPVSPALLAAQAQPSPWVALFPFVVILAIFYFMLILPAQRQRKRQHQMLAALKSGDKVITSGGVYGTIVGLRDEVVQLRIADQVKIQVSRSAIAGHQPQKEEGPDS